MHNMPLFAVREHDEVYHLEVDIKMKIFSFLRNALGPQIKAQEPFFYSFSIVSFLLPF